MAALLAAVLTALRLPRLWSALRVSKHPGQGKGTRIEIRSACSIIVLAKDTNQGRIIPVIQFYSPYSTHCVVTNSSIDSYLPPPMGPQSQNASSSSSTRRLPSPNSLGLHRSPEVLMPRGPAERDFANRDLAHKALPRHPILPEITKDWQVMCNPKVAKALAIDLVHTFTHSR
jgi:hypothetical protein